MNIIKKTLAFFAVALMISCGGQGTGSSQNNEAQTADTAQVAVDETEESTAMPENILTEDQMREMWNELYGDYEDDMYDYRILEYGNGELAFHDDYFECLTPKGATYFEVHFIPADEGGYDIYVADYSHSDKYYIDKYYWCEMETRHYDLEEDVAKAIEPLNDENGNMHIVGKRLDVYSNGTKTTFIYNGEMFEKQLNAFDVYMMLQEADVIEFFRENYTDQEIINSMNDDGTALGADFEMIDNDSGDVGWARSFRLLMADNGDGSQTVFLTESYIQDNVTEFDNKFQYTLNGSTLRKTTFDAQKFESEKAKNEWKIKSPW